MITIPLPWREPIAWFVEFANRPHCVWLDTATPNDEQQYSLLAAEPTRVFQFTQSKDTDTDPFEQLDHWLARHRPVAAIGYFGYDLKNIIEKLPSTAQNDLHLPDCWFGFYDDVLIFDHHRRQTWRHLATEIPPFTKSCYNYNKISRQRTKGVRSNFSRKKYCKAVRRAKEYIAAGDVYQVNLSQRFQCRISASAQELYLALRAANPAPYCAYLDIGEAQILSSSPECFLRMSNREIVTRPIKGTLPRHRDPAELLGSPKDNAELLMITDLERNDLGRVCEFGSVRVPNLVRVETYATVHHLVATVTGQLRSDISHVQALRACFPGGSITGAPKIRAMEIIDELEPHARGVYCGAIGYFGCDGKSHFNIAIRTLVHQSGLVTFHSGGGIVADSDPDAEYQETLAKAEGILRALDYILKRER